MKQSKNRRKVRMWMNIGICFALLFGISTYMVFSQLINEQRDANAFDMLIRQIGRAEPASTNVSAMGNVQPQVSATQTLMLDDHKPEDIEIPAASDAPQRELSSETSVPEFHKYDALYAQNRDLFGWISIDGTELNYPVMYTPDDPEHYLHRAFDGTDSASGVPFLDADCSLGCGNYVVYGHHMKSGAMFAVLMKYADEIFWQEHPTIRFDTVDAPGEYAVMAAFYTKVYRNGDQNAFRYYIYTDLTDQGTFEKYISEVNEAALYDTGVTAEYGDQLLTLSTCSYHTTDGRFVIVAKKIR